MPQSLLAWVLVGGTGTVVVAARPLPPPVLPAEAAARRSVRTGNPFTMVTVPLPEMHVNGNTTVTSPASNSLLAVSGVWKIDVDSSVPYLPVEKVGETPNCQRSAASAGLGRAATNSHTPHRNFNMAPLVAPGVDPRNAKAGGKGRESQPKPRSRHDA